MPVCRFFGEKTSGEFTDRAGDGAELMGHLKMGLCYAVDPGWHGLCVGDGRLFGPIAEALGKVP
jgi:hypothetical protein